DEEITQFNLRHPIGTKPRLAISLLLYLGIRRSDVVKIGPQHVRGGVAHVHDKKTRRDWQIPVHSELQGIIKETPPANLTFLATEYGKPFTAAGFGSWFKDQCKKANLHHCSAHGLRHAQGRKLAEAGCSQRQIMATLGHSTSKQAELYTRAADQSKLAADAARKLAGER